MTASQIDKLRKFVGRRPTHFIACEGPHEKPDNLSMTALLAEIDELKAKLDAQTPPRRLRPYKGVTYRDDAWWLGAWKMKENTIDNLYDARLIADADHAALLALRDDPYLPVETLEEVVDAWRENVHVDWTWKVQKLDLCTRLRAHLSQQTPTLTAGEHIAALVAMGAREATCRLSTVVGNSAVYSGERILILPPEVSP